MMTISDLPHAPSDPASRIPISFNQEFLCLFDKGNDAGPFGPRYHIVHGWHIRGQVDADALRQALRDLIERHETLRTRIVRDDGPPYQEVLPPSAPELVLLDCSDTPPQSRDRRVEELLNEVESGTLGADELPHIRAFLGRFDDHHSILMLIANHTATDGWSMRLIIRDLAILYAIRKGQPALDLPDGPQYRDYAAWQRAGSGGGSAGEYGQYWRDKLRGGKILAVRTDRVKSGQLPDPTAVYRFVIDADVIAPALQAAKAMRSTPFMVLLAAYNVMLSRRTGVTDIIVPTFTTGRAPEFGNTVGSFFNFLPLRTDVAGCRSFREVVDRTRRTCLEAYSHDIPFIKIAGEAPELMLPAMAEELAPMVFQVFPFPFVLDGEVIGDLEYTEIRRRSISQPVGSDVPDGALWTLNLHPAGDVVGSVQFKSNIFDSATISGMVEEFTQTLREMVSAPLDLALG